MRMLLRQNMWKYEYLSICEAVNILRIELSHVNTCGAVKLTMSIILKNYVNICGLRAFTLRWSCQINYVIIQLRQNPCMPPIFYEFMWIYVELWKHSICNSCVLLSIWSKVIAILYSLKLSLWYRVSVIYVYQTSVN